MKSLTQINFLLNLNISSLDISAGNYSLLITENDDMENYISKSIKIYLTNIYPSSYFYVDIKNFI